MGIIKRAWKTLAFDRIDLFFVLVAVGVAAIFLLTGCTTVGPVASQSRDGQTATNSPQNHVTLVDDDGTTTADVAGPTDWTRQDAYGTLSHTTGMVTRTVTYEDGSRKLVVRSGSDIGAKGIHLDPTTGAFSIDSFDTSSSGPLVALGSLQANTVAAMQNISAEQAAVLKTISENQKATILGVAEKVSPEFLAAIKSLLGG